MKVMGGSQGLDWIGLDWIGCVVHRKDFMPNSADLLHVPRRSLSHGTRKRKQTATSSARILRLIMTEI